MRKQQERRSGRQWLVAVLAVALGLTVAGCSASVASNHEHEWEAATCETPRVCKTCGETDGEPLGHTWQEATCLAPKTCTVCGKTEGKKSEDHVWSEATCTEREKCVLCGRVNFHTEPLGHDWIAPTLEAPYTCARCGEQQGEPLKLSAFNRGHNGKWEAHPTKEQYVGMNLPFDKAPKFVQNSVAEAPAASGFVNTQTPAEQPGNNSHKEDTNMANEIKTVDELRGAYPRWLTRSNRRRRCELPMRSGSVSATLRKWPCPAVRRSPTRLSTISP